jgi:hypothetical protein
LAHVIWATAAVGIAGIIGTLLGPWWQQRVAENRRRLADFRTAKRVVFSEVQDLRQQLEALRTNAIAPSMIDFPILEAPGWAEHRNALADALPNEAWRPLTDFFKQLAFCRAAVRSTQALTPLAPHLLALLPDAEATALVVLYQLDTAEPVKASYRAKFIELPKSESGTG